uniref:Methylthioribose-1-phosphate isomerase n=2 Tax=Leptocylindrus danicus TaxID=163516 RepID=A0A7S2PNI4_9STRA|mmetsp:Transcript_7299/g.10903  ORF Transcript_7299/g.10903 Transcript_7299/m.10903 type:complete len:792 (+) Transcript_7299:40-2415(+)
MSKLQSLKYTSSPIPTLSVLDQLQVPDSKVYIPINNVEDAWSVIRKMQVRGAPLIAIVACLGLAVDLSSKKDWQSGSEIVSAIESKCEYLRTSRPTAVNLFNAMDELLGTVASCDQSSADNVVKTVVSHAEMMLARDVADNEAIGAYGADALLGSGVNEKTSIRLMTICNTGSLATAGFGTALGVARELQKRGKLKSIAALETRPYNQGSRLTAFEILEEEMPGGVLICDSSAGYMMKTKGADACVVGADRVCADGSTANKIGTYQLAIAAAYHNVPFYVASPFTTLDTSLKSGADIEIEERPAEELINTSRAPKGMPCWNPAFDVTSPDLITGIITEKGVIERGPDGTFDVIGFVKKHSGEEVTYEEPSGLVVPSGYTEQTCASLPSYIEENSPYVMAEIGATSASDLSAVEMGDGNLNLVFIVTNTKNKKKIIVKQSLPYVRCVGESWPLTLERSHFEFKALSVHYAACPSFTPKVYYFSRANGLMIMEYIPPPNIILRKGLIAGIKYPTVASDLGVFCAKTLFATSSLKLSAAETRQEIEFWSKNHEMCTLTETVIFTEPYIEASNNRWTSPQLDDDKKAIENDFELKLAASKLKRKFMTETQALLHADLHTGSVMCSPEDGKTFVIDPEFAFYGPMGFDVGAILANFMLAYVAQGGHQNGEEYAHWILEQVVALWKSFKSTFCELWSDPKEHKGCAYHRSMFESDEALTAAQDSFIAEIFTDTLGFAGMKMLRRIVGIAHVEDLESIADADARSKCERRGLEIAKELIKEAKVYGTIEDVVAMAATK